MVFCSDCGSELVCPKCSKQNSDEDKGKLTMRKDESIAEFMSRAFFKKKK